MECNRCVCACGNWVCTAMTCEGPYAPENYWFWVWTKGILSLCPSEGTSYPEFFSLQLFLSSSVGAFCIALICSMLVKPKLVPEIRKCVTGLRAVLLGFIVWIWCHEKSALNLPDQSYSASSWCRPKRSLKATVCVSVSKSAFPYMCAYPHCICVYGICKTGSRILY